jgi:hypothetical protein
LKYIDAALDLNDLRDPPRNRLEVLSIRSLSGA